MDYITSITVVILLTFCCVGFSLVLCVAVLNVSCSWFCFCTRGRVGIHFLLSFEYWIMCINVCAIHVQVTFTDVVSF
jgi:hypothetical protein